jgi:hypothetical protein
VLTAAAEAGLDEPDAEPPFVGSSMMGTTMSSAMGGAYARMTAFRSHRMMSYGDPHDEEAEVFAPDEHDAPDSEARSVNDD